MKRKLFAGLALLLSTSVSAFAADMDKNHDDGLPKLRATLSGALGYNTNANDDVRADEEGDFFNEDRVSLTLSQKSGDFNSEIKATADTRQYFEETGSSDWSVGLEASTEYEFMNNHSATVESYFERENDGGDHEQNFGAALGYKGKSNWADWRMKASLDVEDAIEPSGDADNEFDNQKLGVSSKVYAMPNSMISPYVRGHFALVKPIETIASVLDRSALEYGAGAGARFKIHEALEASAGVTYNVRDFKTAGVETYDALFVEAEISWKPIDEFAMEASVGQHFDAASETASYVNDVREYEVSLTAKPLERFSNKVSFKLEQEKEIGADEKSRTMTLKDRATYEVHDHLSVFLQAEQEWKRKNAAGVIEKKQASIGIIGLEAEF